MYEHFNESAHQYEVVQEYLKQALPSVYTLQCLIGKVDNNNNNKKDCIIFKFQHLNFMMLGVIIAGEGATILSSLRTVASE